MTAITSTIHGKYLENDNTKELWDIFHSSVTKSMDNHIPKKKKETKSSLPWVIRSIKQIYDVKLDKQAKASKNWVAY